jgi:hypothetical protein
MLLGYEIKLSLSILLWKIENNIAIFKKKKKVRD